MNTSLTKRNKEYIIENTKEESPEQEQIPQPLRLSFMIPEEINQLLTEAKTVDAETALKLYNRAIELRPDILKIYKDKAFYLSQKEYYKESIEAIQKVLEKEESNVNAYIILSDCLAGIKDYEGCLKALEKALQYDPDNTHLINIYGERLMEVGRNEDALNAYNKAIELDPRHIANGNKGYILSLQGTALLDEAMKYYDKQTQYYPNDWVTYMKKAKLFQLKGDSEKAKAYFTIAGDILEKGTLDGSTWIGDGFEVVLNQHELELVHCMKILLKVPTVSNCETEKQKKRVAELENNKENLKLSIVSEYGSMNTKEIFRRLESLELKAAEHDKEIKELKEAKNKIKDGFEVFRKKNPELLAYCKTFYWTALNLFNVYRGMSTGKIAINFDSIEINNPILKAIQQAANFFAEIAQNVPIAGSSLSTIVSIVNEIGNANKGNQINAINIIIEKKFDLEEEISLSIARLAIALTSAKEKEILNPNLPKKDDSDPIQKGLEKLQNKMQKVKESILPSIDLHDPNSQGASLALDDVTLLMAYLGDNHLDVIGNGDSLDIQIQVIVSKNGLNSLLKDKEFKKRDDCGFCEILKKIKEFLFSK